ncbi:hypothetical protein ABK040_003402 [Willaertia magna]
MNHLDPNWIEAQHRSFLNWTNLKLKPKNVQLTDLPKDLQTGVHLIELLEALTGNSYPLQNLNPTFRIQQINNVNEALSIITDQLKIPLVNIGANDIVDGNKKLVLGLIHALICRYQILTLVKSSGDEEDDEEEIHDEALALSKAEKIIVKWLNDTLYDQNKKIKNLTSDWCDGEHLRRLIEYFTNDDINLSHITDPVEKVRTLVEMAENKLNIPRIVEPQDMVNYPDRFTMLAYLASYRSAKRIGEDEFNYIPTPIKDNLNQNTTSTGPNELTQQQTTVSHTTIFEKSSNNLPSEISISELSPPVVKQTTSVNLQSPVNYQNNNASPQLMTGNIQPPITSTATSTYKQQQTVSAPPMESAPPLYEQQQQQPLMTSINTSGYSNVENSYSQQSHIPQNPYIPTGTTSNSYSVQQQNTGYEGGYNSMTSLYLPNSNNNLNNPPPPLMGGNDMSYPQNNFSYAPQQQYPPQQYPPYGNQVQMNQTTYTTHEQYPQQMNYQMYPQNGMIQQHVVTQQNYAYPPPMVTQHQFVTVGTQFYSKKAMKKAIKKGYVYNPYAFN